MIKKEIANNHQLSLDTHIKYSGHYFQIHHENEERYQWTILLRAYEGLSARSTLMP